ARAYRQLVEGQEVHLPAKTTSFQQWAREVEEYAQTPAVRQEADYWLNVGRKYQGPLPVDLAEGRNTVATARTVAVSLTVEETSALLYEVPLVYRTQVNDLLLTALAQVLTAWTGQSSVQVDLEGHGREEILEGVDLSRTVGWFTSIYPVCLEVAALAQPGQALKA